MRLLLLGLFVGVVAAGDLFGEHKTYEGYKVFEITPTTVQDQDKLRYMMADEELDFWGESRKVGVTTRVMVPPHKVQKVVNYLNKYAIQHSVLVEDMSVVIMEELDRLRERAQRGMVFDIDDFNQLDDIMSELDAMAGRCPSSISCTVETLGQSDEGRDINVLRISSGSGRRGYWIDSAIHAREWLAPATVLKILDYMTRNYGVEDDVTGLINTYDFHFVPVMNPDGYLYSWTDERLWRKSRNVNAGSSCRGTDLNRNYDANWMSDGTSTSPCSDTYGGESVASAVETQIIQAEISRLSSSLDGLLSIHTAAQMWLHPWGHTEGGSCAIAVDNDDLTGVINAATDAVEATNGLTFDRGNCCQTIYPASGSTMDYAKLAGIKYTFTPELRGPGFIIDRDNIEPSFQETFNGLKALIAAIA